MKRVVEPELLDHLPAEHARAVSSRNDLQRLNKIMRHAELFSDALLKNFPQPPKRWADIGAGDGNLMLEVAQRTGWRGIELTLVDQQNIVSKETFAGFKRLGWSVRVAAMDVFDWARNLSEPNCMTANLFLHHFSDKKISELFALLAMKTDFFVACETRRSSVALAASRLVGLLGCNSVTRHDAVLSVKAGFRNGELSSLWPDKANWAFEERGHWFFSHSFIAKQRPNALEFDI